MTRICNINNRNEGHMILSNGEVFTDGVILPFDERMNINPSKYKRLGIRKIKYTISDNPGYPFWIDVSYYKRVNVASIIGICNFRFNITTETITGIGSKIISKLNEYLELKG
jgi:hypothetical protein